MPNPLSLLDSTSPTLTLRSLRQIHAHLLTAGHLNDPFSLGKLVAAVAVRHQSPSHLAYSEELLAHSGQPPSAFILNTLIRAHSGGPSPLLALDFYRRLLRSPSLSPDHYTFTFLIRACAHLPSLPAAGPAAHAASFRRGLVADPHVNSGLVHMYAAFGLPDAAFRVYSELRSPDHVSQTAMLGAFAAAGDIDSARELFDKMPHRDAVAWNAMIAGYSQAGRPREALELFSEMQVEGARVSEGTMVPVLTACADLGALDQGRWAHAYVHKQRIRMTVTLGTALIDMYFKCGDMVRAMEVFGLLKEKNVYTWSSAIGGLAMNGAGEECLELFKLMEQEGVLPNEVTFVAVLRGCGVAGKVDEGCQLFDSMRNQYGMEPWVEHYGCVVNLYGRAGRLDDALAFIKAMPIEPHVGAWGGLLNACRIYRNAELGEYAMRNIVEIESRNHGAYVLLSNIYADSRNWKGVSGVRDLMKAKGVRKQPGCSVIEVGCEVHEFFVGDKSHPRYEEIKMMLEEMSRQLRLAGYVARTNEVLFDIEEEEKENALCWHSEKLAIAFGLIALGEGVTIRIVKNLRVCWDCHDASKFISKVFNREIVMRDRTRFHHFKDGRCSCMDYW